MKYYPIWKIIIIFIVVIFSLFFSYPTFFLNSENENWYSENKINLGLDLQGGSHLLLEVKNEILLNEELNNIAALFRQFLRSEKIKIDYVNKTNESIKIKLFNNNNIDKILNFKNKKFPTLNYLNNDNELVFNLSDTYKKKLFESSIKQSLEIIRKRVDETGTKEPLIQRQGNNRILLQIPGIKNPERIKKLIGKTAKLNFHMVNDDDIDSINDNKAPPGYMIVPDFYNQDILYLVEQRSRVGGENLIDAQPTYDQFSPAVSFSFDPLGARKFAKVTSNNVGKRFAVILDEKVITAPVIRAKIMNGSGIITGNFSIQEAQDLAILLRAGALPAPLEILWASTREPYNFLQSKKLGCHIITIPPPIIEKIEKFGKSFNSLTIDTVRTFLIDSKKSSFKI